LLAFCHARLGNEAEARRIVAELEGLRKQGYDVNEEIGCANVGLRQYDQAVDALEQFVISGTLVDSSLRNPLLRDEMGNHPRFQALLARVGAKRQEPLADHAT
jgi:hypothetical protein